MAPLPEHCTTSWAATIVDALVRAGVTRFVISPGSRSTPLAVAAARHASARCTVAHDERGAGFYAAGHGAATRVPAALICTSGTAVANYYPAVIEASLAAVPLLVLSADRPPELRDTGANQTIAQPGIFGAYARWQFDLPSPSAATPLALAAQTAAYAVARATHAPAGPVHLNCMFAEPLAPVEAFEAAAQEARATRATAYASAAAMPTADEVDALRARLSSARRGVLALGPLAGAAERGAAHALACALGWPVFADIASGLRSTTLPSLVPYFDCALASPSFSRRAAPDVVLHLGGRMTSVRFAAFARQAADYVHVAESPQRRDPAGLATLRVEASLAPFCEALANGLAPSTDPAFAERCARASARVGALLDKALREDLSEPACARRIAARLPEGHGLFLARSMPVRDMDMFSPPGAAPRPVGVNWGASGIDGTIASALGFADGLGRPVTLVIGDLAFLHDLNSLALAGREAHPLTIVLLNNRGGGIFSFLPLETCAELVEPYFAAAHDLTFGRAAELFGLAYAAPRTLPEFDRAYDEALRAPRPALIEVASDRAQNHELHRRLSAAFTELDA
jgi:2-succinyl-5-enolpyruvyl-6-hydroxy-3-cyclohexene-1-carboxylate synthase